ncbi:MAG: helix-turn-helix transcriptional regulator [Microcystis aeruginosa LL13-03]|jgi:DNA-binding XRE family transcriptional regulator|nr:helix-turn-helix transcriptional regulator [Microcystis aeruginosa SX13-11]NCR20088.1 helix-turn-helix transcriptional regulator [Microcystis aeruginosa LL13-03]NCR46724.1 helix-turn-helix transcriptional regulator [Microcystis aeruginosa SX13-01]NCR69343.1 helix-turn-helix transcriptional regulator [Microcystis aeruginosa LL11-07]NCR91780.1 helix-turn-helix transcriptional regulator [Microcystis aeruginosa G13-10]NCS18410.1 helix-turn-helix transcriptional regulator [Microcystis aeruginosa
MQLSFSQWFLIRRREKSLSQLDIAESLGITKQTVSNWERERTEPCLTVLQIQKLCNLFDCKLEDFPHP